MCPAASAAYGISCGGRRCGSGVDAVFQNILVLHRAFLEVIVHLRFFGCNRADYALAECEHQCAVFGCRAERKDSGNGAGEKGTGCLRYTLGRDALIAPGKKRKYWAANLQTMCRKRRSHRPAWRAVICAHVGMRASRLAWTGVQCALPRLHRVKRFFLTHQTHTNTT